MDGGLSVYTATCKWGACAEGWECKLEVNDISKLHAASAAGEIKISEK